MVPRASVLSILVCHSYYLRLDLKQLARAKPYPPLATLQVATLLQQSGHQVRLWCRLPQSLRRLVPRQPRPQTLHALQTALGVGVLA
jgi:hypothetical protein